MAAVGALPSCGGDTHQVPLPVPKPVTLDDPTGIAFDPAGNLWVANYRGNSLLMFGRRRLSLGGPAAADVAFSGDKSALRGPNRLAFDSTGDLWVANYDNNSITEFSASQLLSGGNVSPEVVITAGRGEIDQPTGIAFDSVGNLWITNQRSGAAVAVAKRDLQRSGAPEAAIQIQMPGGRSAIPEAVAFDAAGGMWIALYGQGIVVGYAPRVFQKSGSPAPTANISTSQPIGLAFDRSGELWVTEAGAVRKFDPRRPATPLTTVMWESMAHPHTPVLDLAGDLWFSCQNNSIVKVEASELLRSEVRLPSAVTTSAA